MAASTASIGVSLGSESCVVAITNTSGAHLVCANADGDRVTPTYAAFVDGELLLGAGAKAAMVRQPVQTVPYLLPILSVDVINAGSVVPKCEVEVQLDAESGEERVVLPTVDADGVLASTAGIPKADPSDPAVPHTAGEVLAAFLADVKAKTIDGPVSGRPVGCVTVAVPRYMDPSTVRAVVEGAGISRDVRVISDDMAAVIAHGIASASPPPARADALIVDWGANVLAASLVRVEGGLMRLLGHQHRFGAGATQLDKAIARGLCQTFQRKTKMDPSENGRAIRKLALALEGVRKTLSVSQQASIDIEAFCEGIDLKDSLSRAKMEATFRECGLSDRLNDLLRDLADTVDAAEGLDVGHVVLSGGLCRLAVAQQLVRAAAPRAFGKDPAAMIFYDDGASDETAAVGACIEASLTVRGYTSFCSAALTDVPAGGKYRRVDEAVKEGSATAECDVMAAAVSLYCGAGKFSAAAERVEAGAVAAHPALAKALAASEALATTAANGVYALPLAATSPIIAAGALLPASSAALAVPAGAAVLPLAVVAQDDERAYVVPLFKRPVETTQPCLHILLTTERNGGIIVVQAAEAPDAFSQTRTLLHRQEW